MSRIGAQRTPAWGGGDLCRDRQIGAEAITGLPV